MDAVVAVLAVVVGCVMVHFSAISLYTYLQTGEIVFRLRAGSVSVGAQAVLWHMGQLVFGVLCVAYGASVLRRMLVSVQTPNRRDRSM
ncbi:hypothetical protein MUG10_09335 [Xanthomonas prunicola]|jgi:hypothetical protein|uniref:Uncharacterized protein n=1 Tax=Xanthomonas prunicola TaxID=2053930 RepID=A0A2N3RF01_9XANT|nr:hypothetical protein [Xanthomonas prunicola]PKV11067.1 hypothetical protein XpruCFBP8353_19900 [Xanthomonas prunicola]PKV15286.1 hypothetical protein XpruCFBP8354_20370 [Xanthomonas prunicola]PKV19524.1 hypothetical protein CVO74_21175 [Xanthomonas prunicola]USJ02275.1 hypothetical protein MUG10_09335 [Xanthomonas prunicola]UXA51455.1 hypothetical protein M0D45_11900 [Xanthomonas prunicola]